MRQLGILILLFFIVALPSFAQSPTSIGGIDLSGALGSLGSLDAVTGEQINIGLDPQFPSPGSAFIARLDDYSISNFGATVVWTLNGEELTQFRNSRTVSLTASPVGEKMTLEVSLYGQNGRSYTAKQEIIPRYLDVIIEPITYAPTHYSGRPLPIFGSRVLLTALLHESTGLVNHAEYTYTWQVGNTYIDGGPVRGKYKTFITIPHGLNILVTVEIRDQRGQSVARRLFSIPSVGIDTQFYEVNPLFGMSQKAITNNYRLLSNSSTIYAIPYNLDLYARPESQNIEWLINGRRVDLASNPYQITVSNFGGTSARLQFKIRNTVDLLQGDDKSVTVSF
ncbi:MAG: hypothetical protein ACK42D_01745 [Candidatus Paceibacteria bacterium]